MESAASSSTSKGSKVLGSVRRQKRNSPPFCAKAARERTKDTARANEIPRFARNDNLVEIDRSKVLGSVRRQKRNSPPFCAKAARERTKDTARANEIPRFARNDNLVEIDVVWRPIMRSPPRWIRVFEMT